MIVYTSHVGHAVENTRDSDARRLRYIEQQRLTKQRLTKQSRNVALH